MCEKEQGNLKPIKKRIILESVKFKCDVTHKIEKNEPVNLW